MKKILFLLFFVIISYSQETFIKGRVASSEATRYIRVDTNGYLIVSPTVAISSTETAPVFMRYTAPDSLFTAGAADTTTTSWKNAGAVIDMRGYTQLNLFINYDSSGTTKDFRIQALGGYTALTCEYPFVIETVSSSNIKIEREYIEFNDDGDQKVILKIETDGVPYIQIQYQAGTAGSGKILSSYKSKIWK